ncbi:MAG: flagellar filament capping protein FliD [Terriglobales bacterium]|jgi:flagellar hook-associated protein 2
MGISFNASSLLNGNGLNVQSVVSEIQAAQSGQLTAWQTDVTNLQTQATVLTSINNDLSNLASAVQGFTGANGALTAVTANSSESAIVNATAQTGATAANYTVVVSGLASTGTLYTDEVANATTSILPSGQTSGELNLQIGGSGGTAADIAITAGSNDTLTTLASYINSQSATKNWGVTASVVTDADGARLAIYSQASGSPGALAVTNNTTSMTFEPPVGGTNAEISVNGIPYASTSNTVTGAIPDVTLTLTTADPDTPVTVTVGPDTTSITNSIDNFVTEYNTVISDINTQFTINASTSQEGPLGSDTDLRVLQSSLAADVTYTTTDSTSVSSGFTNLAALGITMNNDGTLSVDSSTLSDALSSNPAAVQNFFTNTNSTGFADNMNTDLANLTDPSTGILTEDLASNQQQQTDLNTEITNFQTQLAVQQTALTQEFDQVNANLEEYPFTLAEVNAALGSLSSLNGSSSSSSTTSTNNNNTTPTSGTSTS